MKWITLFCGARLTKPIYKDVSDHFIEWMVQNNHGLVYGGGGLGIMGYVAKSLLEKGIPVKGVIPESLLKLEVGLKECSELIVVSSMHERKKIMSELGDAFITLPGGFGTLDEVCEIITWNQLQIINKPVGFLNRNNYFFHFKKQVEFSVEEGFISSHDFKKIQWLDEMENFNF